MGLLMDNAAVQVSVYKLCQVIYPECGTESSGTVQVTELPSNGAKGGCEQTARVSEKKQEITVSSWKPSRDKSQSLALHGRETLKSLT